MAETEDSKMEISWEEKNFNQDFILLPKPVRFLRGGIVLKCISRRDRKKRHHAHIYLTSKADRECVENEIKSLRLLVSSTFVISVIDIYPTPSAVFLVMEPVRCDLLRYLAHSKHFETRYSEGSLRMIARDMLRGIQFCHRNRIIHRNIQPCSFFLSSADSAVKLGCFHDSFQVAPNTIMHGLAGQQPYLAPEMFHSAPYSFSADMWSFGVTIYVMLVGYLPFEGGTKSNRIKNKTSSVTFPDYCRLSKFGIDFVNRLLLVEPGCRITVEEALLHPWIARGSGAHNSIHCLEAHENLKQFEAACRITDFLKMIALRNQNKLSVKEGFGRKVGCNASPLGSDQCNIGQLLEAAESTDTVIPMDHSLQYNSTSSSAARVSVSNVALGYYPSSTASLLPSEGAAESESVVKRAKL